MYILGKLIQIFRYVNIVFKRRKQSSEMPSVINNNDGHMSMHIHSNLLLRK